MRPRHVVIGALVLAVLAWAFVVVRPYVWGQGTSTEVSIDEVLRRYHASTTAVPTVPAETVPAETVPAETVPQPRDVPPGVYSYATTGRDEVDALNGDHHDYATTTAITVLDLGNGCRRHRWDVLVERWQEWERCVTADGGVVAVRHVNFDSFFSRSQTDTYDCTGQARPLDAEPGTTWTFTCVQGETDRDVYTGTVVARESMVVGGTAVGALRVEVTIDNGAPTDVQVTTSWYLPGTDLLLAQTAANDTTNPSPVGDVHYRERYDLRLTSLEPLG